MQLNKYYAYILPVYLNCSVWEQDFHNLSKVLLENSNLNYCLMGDFNGRTACLQKIPKNSLGPQPVIQNFARNSKDKISNKNGIRLLKLLEDLNLIFLNGCVKGDLAEELTFLNANGSS